MSKTSREINQERSASTSTFTAETAAATQSALIMLETASRPLTEQKLSSVYVERTGPLDDNCVDMEFYEMRKLDFAHVIR